MIETIKFSEKLRNKWPKEQEDLRHRLESELSNYVDIENTLYDSKYPANLVAHAMTAQRLLNGSSLEGKKIMELGFGTQSHIPLLTRYDADVIGIEIDERVVDMAKQKGYNAIHGDAENIDELLDKNYLVDMVVSAKFFDSATFMMGADSKFLNINDITASIDRVLESIRSGKMLDEKGRYQKAKSILEKLYDRTNRNGIHIHTTKEDEGFMMNKADIEKIGYEIICFNEKNPHMYTQHLTVLRKK